MNTWTCALPLVWKDSLFDGLAEMLTRATGIPHTAERLAEDGPYERWDGPPLRDLNAYPRGGKRF